MKLLGEIFNNWWNDLLGTNAYPTHECCWYSLLAVLQCTNTASAVYE